MAEQIIYAAYQQFRELCQQGKLCWQNRPLPFHVLTGRPFCGINLVLLSLADSDCAAWIDQSGAKRLELDLTEMKRQCIVTFSTEYSKIKIKSAPVYSLSGTQMQSAMPEEPWRSYQLLEDLKIPYKSTEIFNPQVRYFEKLLLMPQDRGSVEASAEAYGAALWVMSNLSECLSVRSITAVDLAAAKLCFYFGQRYENFVSKELICEYYRQLDDPESGLQSLLQSCALSEKICCSLVQLAQKDRLEAESAR